MIEKIKEFCDKTNLELLSEYDKAKTKMDWKCCECNKILNYSWDRIRIKKNFVVVNFQTYFRKPQKYIRTYRGSFQEYYF